MDLRHLYHYPGMSIQQQLHISAALVQLSNKIPDMSDYGRRIKRQVNIPMRTLFSFLLLFFCLSAACVTDQGLQPPTSPGATSEIPRETVLVYSGGMIQNTSLSQIIAENYRIIPDNVNPELLPVIRNSSFSGNISNISRIALDDPCVLKILRDGGIILGVDYFIPFQGPAGSRMVIYVPAESEDRRISVMVNETSGKTDYLFVEYRYLTWKTTQNFTPFTDEGWAGGYACEKNKCPDVC